MTRTAVAPEGGSHPLNAVLSPSTAPAVGTPTPKGVGGFQHGQTVRSLASVKPPTYAGRTGQVVSLFRCERPCVNPVRHDEIGVRLGGQTVWFRASELEPVA